MSCHTQHVQTTIKLNNGVITNLRATTNAGRPVTQIFRDLGLNVEGDLGVPDDGTPSAFWPPQFVITAGETKTIQIRVDTSTMNALRAQDVSGEDPAIDAIDLIEQQSQIRFLELPTIHAPEAATAGGTPSFNFGQFIPVCGFGAAPNATVELVPPVAWGHADEVVEADPEGNFAFNVPTPDSALGEPAQDYTFTLRVAGTPVLTVTINVS